ncbi:peptidoglycan-binding domain-containing protein [Streptomyces coeruleorubidus]|uniref:peptidoglycan-binding domain-containing protein n=1 Tax=Streptomyces coeruleorubidus TaxID=116188 RepID=UPI0033C39048
MSSRSRFAAISVAGVAACTMVLSSTPASANVSQGVIYGGGKITDDWGDEGPLSSSHYSTSHAVGLWQWVLYTEGVKEQDGTPFDQSDIDCAFGPNTTYATKQLQRKWGLAQDGIVGPDTFGKADNNLFRNSDTQSTIYYQQSDGGRTVKFLRVGTHSGGPGPYSFTPPNNTWHRASYRDTGC